MINHIEGAKCQVLLFSNVSEIFAYGLSQKCVALFKYACPRSHLSGAEQNKLFEPHFACCRKAEKMT
ncbi:hypothetical protein [Roseinatronobacter thiooxidans]|uniref:hypothetical protein n=1 Tax=Roseinatronobacter thiooxidans TaxID=121821 RepID=UPI0008F847CD|nr:hypothetical protein [Roseinatronobacter thiooxidans]